MRSQVQPSGSGLPALIVGPAYPDRIVRVDSPILGSGQILDRSVEGRIDSCCASGTTLRLVDSGGTTIRLLVPPDWPGPWGTVELNDALVGQPLSLERELHVAAWLDDLGGMGAGYAKALGGTLLHALGDAGDPKSRAVESLLRAEGIHFRPIRIPGATADWSLLISSGPHGDKLPIGFRGCHAAIELAALTQAIEAISHQVRIVASFPNSLAATALAARGTAWRVFAPAARNMIDRACPIQSFAASIDLLVGNRTEWRMLPANEREVIDEALSLRFETDGPNGFRLRIRDSTGRSVLHEEAAFPRKRPPRDTNRAGEACAASLIRTLATAGWFPGIFPSSDLIRVAARRASAAAGLILDFEQFGFPTEDQIEHAIEEGVIP